MRSDWMRGAAVAIACVCLAGGCGKPEKPKAAVYPVSGKVTVGGKPPAQAEIRMRPKFPFQDPGGRSIEPFGIVQDDGTFKIGMYSGDDGAAPGEYALTMIWPNVKLEAGEEIREGDRLRGKYADEAKPIAVFVVKEGDNQIPEIKLP